MGLLRSYARIVGNWQRRWGRREETLDRCCRWSPSIPDRVARGKGGSGEAAEEEKRDRSGSGGRGRAEGGAVGQASRPPVLCSRLFRGFSCQLDSKARCLGFPSLFVSRHFWCEVGFQRGCWCRSEEERLFDFSSSLCVFRFGSELLQRGGRDWWLGASWTTGTGCRGSYLRSPGDRPLRFSPAPNSQLCAACCFSFLLRKIGRPTCSFSSFLRKFLEKVVARLCDSFFFHFRYTESFHSRYHFLYAAICSSRAGEGGSVRLNPSEHDGAWDGSIRSSPILHRSIFEFLHASGTWPILGLEILSPYLRSMYSLCKTNIPHIWKFMFYIIHIIIFCRMIPVNFSWRPKFYWPSESFRHYYAQLYDPLFQILPGFQRTS